MKKHIILLIGSLMLFAMSVSNAATLTSSDSNNNQVTLVEYYDYECPHCRRMESVIEELQKQFSQLRVIHRVAPVLRPQSRMIAALALSARAQGKWLALHEALMQQAHAPSITQTLMLAKQLGINTQQLIHDAQQVNIQKQLQRNIQWLERHSIRGAMLLPTLVFGKSNGQGQSITLTGEQALPLLAAIVQQLSQSHVQTQTLKHNKPPGD